MKSFNKKFYEATYPAAVEAQKMHGFPYNYVGLIANGYITIKEAVALGHEEKSKLTETYNLGNTGEWIFKKPCSLTEAVSYLSEELRELVDEDLLDLDEALKLQELRTA
jgi:hypothetical protein